MLTIPAVLALADVHVSQSAASVRFTVTPAAAGKQLVRVSLPFPKGFVVEGKTIVISVGKMSISPGFRPLTYHPHATGEAKSVRRGIVTFPFTFKGLAPVEFIISTGKSANKADSKLPVSVKVSSDRVEIDYASGRKMNARFLAPARTSSQPARVETVESNAFYLWQRYHLSDDKWPRVIEVRADALGEVVVVAHLQRRLPDDAYAPAIGWSLNAAAGKAVICEGKRKTTIADKQVVHEFADESTCSLVLDNSYTLYNPAAAIKRKGGVSASVNAGKLSYTYYRCSDSDKVPMQPMSWQRCEFVIAPARLAPVTVTLESPHKVAVDWRLWDELYATGKPIDTADQPELAAILKYHRDATVRSVSHGSDWGNVTSYSDSSETGGTCGMNRLNHCPPIFFEAYRGGDPRLSETGVLWCDNMYDQSIWWGDDDRGGTRYNNAAAHGAPPPFNDDSYMWRSNRSVNFCTKGYDSFFLAYEQTGDPRMLEALEGQVAYASQTVHANTGECRNIGDVRDFVRLYEYTGEKRYLDEALRLFRELRTKLSTGDLFDQGGKPLDAVLPFIDADATGGKYGYAKPYIIGYALCGLPELLRYAPDEPKLRDVVQAVADFLADSQDPIGGWRYPHPKSSNVIVSQGIEHAWQISQADKSLGAQEKHLDAIERTLRQRILGWKRTGRMFSGITGWERATGRLKQGESLESLYAHPEDRDFTRDYADGSPGFGGGSPEAIVYFPEVLEFYLRHRPASRLFEAPKADDPLAKVLARVDSALPKSDPGSVAACGVMNNLPVFADRAAGRLTFPMSWSSGRHKDFAAWKKTARAKVMECLLAPPPVGPFEPKVIAEEDRGSYVARKIEFNVTADSRVLAYVLAPKSPGRHPAVLLLHDHGARFDIGKEKVIRPFGSTPEKTASAEQWVGVSYGGRYIGDELAKRGYVCFCTDALNWSDRGGAGYDGQQALASNLFQMGMSFAGLIAYEDLRAAEFVAGLPEVDPKRIASMGLSMGCFRTWQVAALSDHISAGVAICWMATTKGLMVPGNNQTGGQSSYSMLHPGLRNYLDYPDVASIACPKPMLFYNGLRDGLFPVSCVNDAYAKMHAIWDSQGAGKGLVTKLWDVPHCFDREMQEEAFAWLDGVMHNSQ